MKPHRMKNYLHDQFSKDAQGHTTFHRYCVAVFNDYLAICQAALVVTPHDTLESFLGQVVDKHGGRVDQPYGRANGELWFAPAGQVRGQLVGARA